MRKVKIYLGLLMTIIALSGITKSVVRVLNNVQKPIIVADVDPVKDGEHKG